MKALGVVCLALSLALAGADAEEAATNPLAKVLELLSGLQQQVISEGQAAQTTFNDISSACEDRSRELHHEIKAGKASGEELKALINEQSATILALTQKIEDLGGNIADNEAELKEGTEIREHEAATFGAEEKELLQTLDAIKRATAILERAAAGAAGAASLAQLKGARSLVQVFTAMVQANAVNSADASRLTALVQMDGAQESDEDDADDEALGVPAGNVYEGKGGAVADALENLSEKAEDQLEAARKAETNALHNYQMKKQALEDEMKQQNKDMTTSKQSLSTAQEKKASAEGELSVGTKDLEEVVKVLGDLHHDCMAKAAAFQEETKIRGEELSALAAAKTVLSKSTGGAEAQVYSYEQQAPSFVQVKMASAQQSAIRVVHLIRRLAADASSSHASSSGEALSQLSSRIASAIRGAALSGSAAPFDKVKGMIQDMLAKLRADADKDAEKKAYCEKEMAYTTEKKDEKEEDIESLSTKIEQMSAGSVKLKEEVAVLSQELGALLRDQAVMDKIRAAEKQTYMKARPEIEQGIEGVKSALKILRDYYAQSDDVSASSTSAGADGIIGAMEVIESDFSKQLAEIIAEEERATSEYDDRTKENEVSKSMKEADVKYKTQEAASLDKTTTDSQGDLANVNEEYAAVMEYFDNIQKACTAKAEPYEERAKARANEIQGLKEAMQILASQSATLIQRSARRTLRGAAVLSADDN